MESIPIENDITFIHLPEVEKTEMEVVLQFLYTGKMKITKSLMKPVQKLLEEVLRIDINFKMPICEEYFDSQGNSKENNDCIGDCESGYGTDTNTSSSDFLSSMEPPQKR